MSNPELVSVSPAVRDSFLPILQAVARAREDLAGKNDVAAVRPGYKYPTDAPPQPAVVVAVTPGERPVAEADLENRYGVPVVVADATVEEQLARLSAAEPVSFGTPGGAVASAFENLVSGEEIVAFAPPKSGAYEPLDPSNLPLVDEPMELTICVSPEAGWSELEDFLDGTRNSLTVAMYQFTAPHIYNSVYAAVSPEGRQFELVLHPRPEKPSSAGVKAHELEETSGVLEPLGKTLQDRFEMAWATLVSKAHPDGLWASAYHIKVAVRDGNAAWVSSGNWQSSNQPNVHPFQARRRAARRFPAQVQPGLSCDPQERAHSVDLREIYQARSRSLGRSGRRADRLRHTRPVRAGSGGSARAFRHAAAVLQAPASQSLGQRSAAAHAGQLRGKRAGPDPLGRGEHLVPEPVHQLPRTPTTILPNSSCWSAH